MHSIPHGTILSQVMKEYAPLSHIIRVSPCQLPSLIQRRTLNGPMNNIPHGIFMWDYFKNKRLSSRIIRGSPCQLPTHIQRM